MEPHLCSHLCNSIYCLSTTNFPLVQDAQNSRKNIPLHTQAVHASGPISELYVGTAWMHGSHDKRVQGNNFPK